jgi:hypothetical protein
MNWDLIPQVAIADLTVMTNNPVYGLNALGGAVNVIMKDGFGFQGASIDTRFGSFGFKEVAIEAGQKAGNWGRLHCRRVDRRDRSGATCRRPRPSAPMRTSASRGWAPSSISATRSPIPISAWWGRLRSIWSMSGARMSSPRRSRSTTACTC